MDSLRDLLDRHGLGKYADLLAEQSIDVDVLPDLNDADLEKLGIPMGDRRRFLKADWSSESPEHGRGTGGSACQRRRATPTHGDVCRPR